MPACCCRPRYPYRPMRPRFRFTNPTVTIGGTTYSGADHTISFNDTSEEGRKGLMRYLRSQIAESAKHPVKIIQEP